MLGFNQDEAGRKVWDGVNPNIAGRNIDLNRRFALPGGNVMLYELGHEAPSWWGEWSDPVRGYGMASVLDRCRQTNTCPKILETFGSAEIWGLRQSYALVGSTAKGDIALPARRPALLLSGRCARRRAGRLQHDCSAGHDRARRLRPDEQSCAQRSNAIGAAEAFTDWVTKGTPMPPDRYPRVADGTLVAPTSGAMGFPKIPGAPIAGRRAASAARLRRRLGVQLSRSIGHRLSES